MSTRKSKLKNCKTDFKWKFFKFWWVLLGTRLRRAKFFLMGGGHAWSNGGIWVETWLKKGKLFPCRLAPFEQWVIDLRQGVLPTLSALYPTTRAWSGKSSQGVPRGMLGSQGGCLKNSRKLRFTMFKFLCKKLLYIGAEGAVFHNFTLNCENCTDFSNLHWF